MFRILEFGALQAHEISASAGGFPSSQIVWLASLASFVLLVKIIQTSWGRAVPSSAKLKLPTSWKLAGS